ncbi:MAG: hypothetical protein P8016_08595 [Sedimentisphaerales bacterium]
MMKPPKHILLSVSVIIAILLVSAILYLAVDGFFFWYCNPSAIRGSGIDAWNKAITPTEKVLKREDNFFDNFVVSSDANYYRVERRYKNPQENPFSFELGEMSPGDSFEIGRGTLEFSNSGVSYLSGNEIKNEEIKIHFYDKNFQPLSEEYLRKENIYTVQDSMIFQNNPYPYVQFRFGYKNTDDIKVQSIQVFDRNTRKVLNNGYGTSLEKKYCNFESEVQLWYKTPIDLVIELSVGPSKTYDFLPKPGEGFKEGDFECRLIDVFEGITSGYRSYSSTVNMRTYKFPKAASGDAAIGFFFACYPAAWHMPVQFEFLDANGQRLSRYGGGSTGSYVHSEIFRHHSLEDVALIRAKYLTKRYCVIVHLPYIPGLPEKNKTIDNLFDVYIPYAKFDNSGMLEQFLRKTLQLGNCSTSGPIPSNSIKNIQFPLEFKNATVRDIAKIYAKGGTLKVDIENDRLVLEYPLPLSARVKQFLQRILQRK